MTAGKIDHRPLPLSCGYHIVLRPRPAPVSGMAGLRNLGDPTGGILAARLATLSLWRVFGDYDDVQANRLPPRPKRGAMITASQCRSARALLGWSLAKLAAAAGIAESDLDAFELERGIPPTAIVNAIEQAFAGVGVLFLEDGDIRMLRPGETLAAGAESP
jgi:hypothetical protein